MVAAVEVMRGFRRGYLLVTSHRVRWIGMLPWFHEASWPYGVDLLDGGIGRVVVGDVALREVTPGRKRALRQLHSTLHQARAQRSDR